MLWRDFWSALQPESRPHEESNLDPWLRRPVSYPLDHKGIEWYSIAFVTTISPCNGPTDETVTIEFYRSFDHPACPHLGSNQAPRFKRPVLNHSAIEAFVLAFSPAGLEPAFGTLTVPDLTTSPTEIVTCTGYFVKVLIILHFALPTYYQICGRNVNNGHS